MLNKQASKEEGAAIASASSISDTRIDTLASSFQASKIDDTEASIIKKEIDTKVKTRINRVDVTRQELLSTSSSINSSISSIESMSESIDLPSSIKLEDEFNNIKMEIDEK